MEQIVIPRGCIIVTGATKTGKSTMANAYAQKYPDSTLILDDAMLYVMTPSMRKRIFKEAQGKKIVIITEDPSRYTTEEPAEECSEVKGKDWTYCEVNELEECCPMDDECECCCADFSFWAKAVGLQHCGSYCDPEVRDTKECYADIIDHLNDARESQSSYEKKRLYSVAITEAETACMWAVKAITN